MAPPDAAGSGRLATMIRVHSLEMVHRARAAHIGSSLSIADILAVLYDGVLNVDPKNPSDPGRDRLFLGKGHAAAALYAALAEAGFFPVEMLRTYCADGSRLAGHVTHAGVPGVEASFGSLGHGLPIACGNALALRGDGNPARVFAILSDGECDEGSTWEACLFAGSHGLGNLVAIVDYNRIQSLGRVEEVMDLEPLSDKWRAFGWAVVEVDGHDHAQLRAALAGPADAGGRPRCVLAHTVKGKGVSFMEDRLAWHYSTPSQEQLRQALDELGA
ncbi:MAG TPA: transketolase [Candidatus Dormibacteraeota bacterium]|jgi:transketolase|nr:transketolase [Candidatus Dormibacteraeota bacterium]